MKKNAGFKATAVLLSFLLVLQISPITAWADELNSSVSETVSSQRSSGEAEGDSASDFQEPGVSSEIPGTASSRENFSVEGTASSETASETVSEQESGPSSDTEASSQEASGSQAEASGPEKETTPESLEELVASVLVTNGNENPINEPDLSSQYGYELPPAEEEETYEILGEDTSLREESIKYFRLKDGAILSLSIMKIRKPGNFLRSTTIWRKPRLTAKLTIPMRTTRLRFPFRRIFPPASRSLSLRTKILSA